MEEESLDFYGTLGVTMAELASAKLDDGVPPIMEGSLGTFLGMAVYMDGCVGNPEGSAMNAGDIILLNGHALEFLQYVDLPDGRGVKVRSPQTAETFAFSEQLLATCSVYKKAAPRLTSTTDAPVADAVKSPREWADEFAKKYAGQPAPDATVMFGWFACVAEHALAAAAIEIDDEDSEEEDDVP